MNIAEQIKAFHSHINTADGSWSIKDYEDFVDDCEQKASAIEQDWDNGSTTYTFVDGSVIVWSEQFVETYGAKQ